MAALLCRTCSRPLGVALEQLHHRIAFLRSTPPLPALSQLQTHSLACNLRAWQARVQPALAGKAFRGCRAFPASSDTDAAVDTRPKLVFLGTPEVAADVLFKLFSASSKPDALFQVAAVVTQPGKKRNDKPRKPLPVEVLAAEWLSPEQILCPETASNEDFLEALKALQPDVCLTAAYGNYLPSKFLSIPKQGTVNIHPSLLPKYRGAAPVQRALQDGVRETGVSLLYTVKAMDAGPIIAQESMHIDDGIQADALLFHLFAEGTRLFLDNLGSILSGEAQKTAHTQDESQVSHADKLRRADSKISWDKSAQQIHNEVRALFPWPGSTAMFMLEENPSDSDEEVSPSNKDQQDPDVGPKAEIMVLKVTKTVVGKPKSWKGKHDTDITITKDALHVKCDDGSILSVLQVQKPGKKPVSIQAFANGELQNRRIHRNVPQDYL